MWRYQWLILSALVLTDAYPHHSSTLEKVAAHRRQRHHARAKPAFAEVQQKRGAHLEDPPVTAQTTPETIKLSTTSKPMCSSEVELLRQVFLTQRREYFKDGEPYHGYESMFNRNNAKLLVPNGCQRWKSEDHCCSSGFFEGLSEAATSIETDFAFVKYQYKHFEQEVINKAEEKATEETKKRLGEAVELAKPGLQAVVDFIEKCEDPLRRFFSFTACTLCTPGLDESLTEGQTLHWSAENCTTLKQDCETMPRRLKEAGRKFLEARDVLKIDKSEDSQELWYNHATTWLDRAGKLALVRSKKVKFYATTDFCKLVEKEGYVYKPELWGDVLMLHISSLATDEEKQNFLPKNQLHFISPKVDQLSSLKQEAEEVEAELAGEEAGEEGGSEGGVDTAGLLEVDAEEMTDAADSEGLTLNCVNGEHRGSHCACQECYSGVECNKPMPQGPYVRQEFEPLVVQATAGAQQSLAIKGCRMHHDLRHQLARITLIPGHHELEHADQNRQDELCRVSNPHADALKIRIPQMVTTEEYIYLVDIPVGASPWYQVCYCYGVECTENTTSISWYRIGEVQVVESHQDRDEIVSHMFTPQVTRERRIVERDEKTKCNHNWELALDATFKMEHFATRIEFHCLKGFKNLKGVSELTCDNGVWKVSKRSYQSPEALKLMPDDMEVWDDGYFPMCTWSGEEECHNTSVMDVISVISKESPPVVNEFSEDGQVHYRCHEGSDGSPMRLVVKGMYIPNKAQVLTPGGHMAEVESYDAKTQKYKVLLGPKHVQEVEPAKLEYIWKETSFTRRCEGGKYVPSNVTLRCMPTTPAANDVISASSPEKTVPYAEQGAQTEPEPRTQEQGAQTEPETKTEAEHAAETGPETNTQAEHAAETGPETNTQATSQRNAAAETEEAQTEKASPFNTMGKMYQEHKAAKSGATLPLHAASFLQEEEVARAAQAHKAKSNQSAKQKMMKEAIEKEQPFLIRSWPLKLSTDTGPRVFHVDACWTDPSQCGEPPMEDARYLQKDFVQLNPAVPGTALDADPSNIRHLLAAGGILLSFLLVWCCLRERFDK